MKGTDEKFMRRALVLARKGMGRVSPNPMVGAVIVKSGKIIGEGWHGTYGGKHAEIVALEKTNASSVIGSTLYVTLEPCAHFGKTPPCVDRILQAGISRVVIGTKDPNPLVSGKSIRKLKDDVPEAIKSQRLTEMITLQNKLSSKSKRKDVGMVFEVLIEGLSKRSAEFLSGRTSQNKVVVFKRGNLIKGEYTRVMIERVTSATLIGTTI